MTSWRIIEGDCRERLAELDSGSIQTCVTSPPYFGLRDYGHDGQIGLEPTPDEFVAALVGVFREVRRVLRDDGTVWLNLGDSYATTSGGGQQVAQTNTGAGLAPDRRTAAELGVKSKDLLGIPWMVAFALRADGWYLRSDIIWSKPNPMPESVTDRPTKAHEYLFLLSKAPRYYYDADAIREGMAEASAARYEYGFGGPKSEALTAAERDGAGTRTHPIGDRQTDGRRNKRSVWTVATQPYPGAHFATFPAKLIEPCILAGCPERACGECGAPWTRVVERTLMPTAKAAKTFVVDERDRNADANDQGSNRQKDGHRPGWINNVKTLAWKPSCAHDAPITLGTVLDPFAGAGTTGMVALRHGRSFVGIELSPDYVRLARDRIIADAPLMNQVAEVAA